MKTDDMVQMGALALIGFLAYQKFAKAKQPVATVTPGLQPSQQIINTPLDPDFGMSSATANDPNWGDATAPGYLQQVIEWAF